MKRPALLGFMVLALAASGAAQEFKPDENTAYDKDSGIILRKPKDERWQVKKDGGAYFGPSAKCCVSHVIDNLSCEVMYEVAEAGKSFKPLAEIGADTVKHLEAAGKGGMGGHWKDVKISKKQDKSKFPGAGGFVCFEIEATITTKEDAKKELRQWIFMRGKSLIQFVVFGDAGEFKKKIKDVSYILGSLQFRNPPPK